MPEGSWKCEKCNNINYPFRTKCNRQNCGADKPSEKKESPSETADANDQVCCVTCLHCMILNFNYLLLMVLCIYVTEPNCYIVSCYLGIYFTSAILIFLLFLNCMLVLDLVSSFHVLIELSTVPVSTRNVWEGPESSSTLLSMGVWKSVMSSSCCWRFRVTEPCYNLCQVVLTLLISRGLDPCKFASCVCQIACARSWILLLFTRF